MEIDSRHVYCMDALEFLSDCIENGIKADAIVTDPPYMIAKEVTIVRKEWADIRLDFGSWDKFDDLKSFLAWTFSWMDLVDKILRPGGIFISFFDRNKINFMTRYAESTLHYKMKNLFAWCKTNAAPQYRKVKMMTGWEVAVVMQKPSGFNEKTNEWEYKNLTFNSHLGQHPDWFDQGENDDPRDGIANDAFWYKNSITQGNERKEAMIIRKKQVPAKGEGKRQMTLSGADPTETEIEKVRHPTQKPINVMKLLVDYWTNPGDLVIDPFCGVGSTMVACELSNRHWIGNDNDKKWSWIATKRLKKYMKDADKSIGLDAFMKN